MKHLNKTSVLNIIRKKSVSRADLARETGLTRAAISFIVDDLIQSGLIVEAGTRESKYGRRPIKLKINNQKLYCIGVSIRYGICLVGISTINGNIVSESILDFSDLSSPKEGVLLIVEAIRKLLSEHVTDQDILGIGISAPGPVDIYTGRIINPPNLKQWNNVPVVEDLKEHFNYTIFLEKDSVSSGLSEKNYGSGKGHKNFIYIEIVTGGIGSVIVINNEIYRGDSGFAGEFGHVMIEADGKPCSCGNRGCLERYGAVDEIINSIHSEFPEIKTWEQIVEGSKEDDRLLQVIKDEARYIGMGIITVMNLLDLEAVIIGGVVIPHTDLLIKEISAYIGERLITRASKNIPVYAAREDDSFSFLPSATIVSEKFFSGELIENFCERKRIEKEKSGLDVDK